MAVVKETIRMLQSADKVSYNDHVERSTTKQTQIVEDTNTSLCVTCMKPGGNTKSMYSYFGNIHSKVWRPTAVGR